MGGDPRLGWWLPQAGKEPSSSWLLDNPSPPEEKAVPSPGWTQVCGQHQAPARRGWDWTGMIFEVLSTSESPLLGGFRWL